MASDLFASLYKRSRKADCAVVHKLIDFDSQECFFSQQPVGELVLLAEALLSCASVFRKSMQETARRHGLYDETVRVMCPDCGDPDCPAAVPHVKVKFPAG